MGIVKYQSYQLLGLARLPPTGDNYCTVSNLERADRTGLRCPVRLMSHIKKTKASKVSKDQGWGARHEEKIQLKKENEQLNTRVRMYVLCVYATPTVPILDERG